MKTTALDTFTRSYIETALWSSNDNADESGGEPLDANYTADDIDKTTLETMIGDCRDFQESFGTLIAGRESRAGHDFWLTRNHHGAGFWDGDWDDEYKPATQPTLVPQYRTVGDFLTAMSRPYGSFDLCVGDDGRIYGQ